MPNQHADGVYRARIVAGQRSFQEWREEEARRAYRDPDVPELVSALDAFRERWLPRAAAAASRIPDADERAEVEEFLSDWETAPSLTCRAKQWAAAARELPNLALAGSRDTWAALVEQGIEDDLEQFYATLDAVQAAIRRGPLHAEELTEMHDQRERCAEIVESWLDERRAQLAAHIDDETFTMLGLGNVVPLALPDVPLEMLARFGPAALA